MTERIELLRSKLHSAWGKCSSDEVLTISQELDVEIVKYMRRQLNSRKGLLKRKVDDSDHNLSNCMTLTSASGRSSHMLLTWG
ncbi:aspartyl-phosphate phosphatase Spo0E family protein [Desulfosporosinus sp. FKB]|uniref:aspartyl-phosphate phosphatase Spo0E family protein n=1 Tax=Desulfosporosinus sp. FKB TaxID=1969835 RepID=UPI000B4A39F2|nr:aspartyl-phosphate phosphatase Spo0E family protein [Desulfosporosinus sp. FKB]